MSVEVAGDGDPVLVFHGTPGSRLDAHFWAAAAREDRRMATFIGFDRPGYGDASPEPGRSLDDVARYAATLHPGRIKLLGLSGGGPFALATAVVLGDRLESLTVVSGFGPPEYGLGALAPIAGLDRAGVTAWARELIAASPPPKPTGNEVLDRFMVSAAEGTRTPEGIVDDVLTLRQSWNIEFGAIDAPTTFFHADDDDRCPIKAARALASQIFGARLVEWSGGGHMAMAFHGSEVLAQVC